VVPPCGHCRQSIRETDESIIGETEVILLLTCVTAVTHVRSWGDKQYSGSGESMLISQEVSQGITKHVFDNLK
jgi:hypothetical protein